MAQKARGFLLATLLVFVPRRSWQIMIVFDQQGIDETRTVFSHLYGEPFRLLRTMHFLSVNIPSILSGRSLSWQMSVFQQENGIVTSAFRAPAPQAAPAQNGLLK